MNLKNWQKNILSAVVIAVGGFLLWNAAFILAAVVMRVSSFVMGLSDDQGSGMIWKYLFLIVMLLISWLVFRAKRFKPLVKATYLTMPLMAMLIIEGIQFYKQPQWVPISIGAAIVLVVLLYLYKKKLPWQYYFASVYSGIVALLIVLLGIDI